MNYQSVKFRFCSGEIYLFHTSIQNTSIKCYGTGTVFNIVFTIDSDEISSASAS
jgi:hypothetical protein